MSHVTGTRAVDHIICHQNAVAHDALRSEQAAEIARLRAALDLAASDIVAGHYHIAERLSETDWRWLMHHLEASFSRVCDALGESPLSDDEAPGAGGEGES